jgi:hypothetical protein
MLQCKFSFNSSFPCLFTAIFCDTFCHYRHLFGFRC